MTGQQINPKVAAYLAEMAKALEGLTSRDCGFGEFYITKVEIGYDGEPAGLELFADEFGGLSIRVKDNPA